MTVKKTTASTGSQVFLSHSVQAKIADIQMKMAMVDQESFRLYTGKGALSSVVEKLAEKYSAE
tara:strand:- start:683 stop:871 length:189 start_codon:yes stop_codon:yes gene_type:complete